MQATDKAQKWRPGYCKRCGKELTKNQSRAAGIGPICAERLRVSQEALAKYNMSVDPNLVAADSRDGSIIIRINESVITVDSKYNREVIKVMKSQDGIFRRSLWHIPKGTAQLKAALALPDARIFIKDLAKAKKLLEGNVKAGPPKQEVQSREARLIKDRAVLRFPFPKDADIIPTLKNVSGWKYDGNTKTWSLPICLDAYETLKTLEFKLAPVLKKTLKKHFREAKIKPVKIKGLRGPDDLRPFQKAGVAFVEAYKGRAIIGDDMGLGKTLQALAWLHYAKAFPALCVVPPTAKYHWLDEVNKWMPKNIRASVLSGTTPYPLRLLNNPHIVIASYNILLTRDIPDMICRILHGTDEKAAFGASIIVEMLKKGYYTKVQPKALQNMLEELVSEELITCVGGGYHMTDEQKEVAEDNRARSWSDELSSYGFKTMVMDEFHRIKNYKSLRARATLTIGKTVKHIVALSGTPITNRPIEFFNGLNLIAPKVFPNRMAYAKRYCGAYWNGFGWNFKGATNKIELHDKLKRTIMIRRKKSEVLTELPDTTYTSVPLELTGAEKAEYEDADRDYISWILAKNGRDKAAKARKAEALVRANTLRNLIAHLKLPLIQQWVEDFLESGEKLVLFAWHKEVQDALYTALKKLRYNPINTKGSKKKANEKIKQFQESEKHRVFVGSLSHDHEVITLTAASNVAFVELPWTPGNLKQARDRVRRMTQRNAVNVWYLLAKNTIDKEMAEILAEKVKVLDAILDGKKPDTDPNLSILGDLMKRLAERRRETA